MEIKLMLITSCIRNGLLGIVLVLVVGSGGPGSAPQEKKAALYLDPDQPMEKRIDDLIGRLTLEEKALVLFHNAPAIPRLQIPAWGGWNQCLHGVMSKRPTTLFPVSIAMAATWDPALIHDVTDAIGDEARALYNVGGAGPRGKHGLVYRAPVINISRDPRWGRVQECFGEDPYLTSRIGVAYVQGLQGDHPRYLKVASTLKHFAVNNQEQGRFSLSANPPERLLMEYWLPHFKACVVEGKAQSLMAAYNAIDGVPCAVNKRLLTDILRGQWGFDGAVVSDLGGIQQLMKSHKYTKVAEEAVAAALAAGCDLDDEEFRDALPSAVKKGLISDEVLHRALSRVLRIAFRVGAFDPPELVPYSKIGVDVIESPAHRKLALKTAHEAIVLLKNNDGFLPLNGGKLRKVAVIGPAAERPEYGNYYTYSKDQRKVSPLDGLKARLGKTVDVVFAQGCDMTKPAGEAEIAKAADAAKNADVAIVFLGTNGTVEREGIDRKNLNLPGSQEQLLKAVVQANPRTVAVLLNAGPLSVKWAKDNAAAILEAWYPGEEGGTAIAEVLLGDVNPAGRLPYTVYDGVEDIPPQTEYDITKGFTYLYFAGKAQFPFGHGLSYTRFRYDDLKLAASRLSADGRQQVSVRVKNIGDRAGDEVAQLYVHHVNSAVKRPLQELRGFERVHLKAGEEKTVTLALAPEKLAYYSVEKKGWVIEPGMVEVMVGSSSADIRLRQRFAVTPNN
jgi:beta-glucosidase